MCYFEHIYFTDFASKVLLSGLYCHEPSLPTLKVDWLKIVLPLVASSWQYQQKTARQVFKNLLPILCLSQEIGFMKQLRLWLWLFFLFMSFTAPFVCESHQLRFSRRAPQKAVLFHVLAAFRLVALLYYKLILLLWDDGTHLRFCFTSFAPQPQYTSERTRAHARVCTPPAVNCMATFRAYMAHGVPSLQRSVRSLLISSVSRLGSLLRACHGLGTLLDDRTTRFQAVMSQTQWLVSAKHIKIELSLFTDGFHFVATPYHESRAPPKASLVVSCWRCILKF